MPQAKKYPEGSRIGDWFLSKEDGKPIIRRRIDFPNRKYTQERLPKIKYFHLLDKPRELEDLCIRMNGKDPRAERIKGKLKFKHAFISEELLEDYRENFLFAQIPTRKDAQSYYSYLMKYCFEWFIVKMQLVNPLDWHREQFTWGKYLLNKPEDDLEDDLLIFEGEEIKSARVIRDTVNELNRFMKYLHMKRPDEVPALTFEPINKASYKQHEARRKMSDDVHVSKYIPPIHYKKITKHLEENEVFWRQAVYLAYNYGLRRNEALGLKVSDIKKGYLYCERQLKSAKDGKAEYRPLKNRLPRKVPHWFCSAGEAYEMIESIQLLHPDTLSDYFSILMAELELPAYTFHDLRRTFITNAVKKKIEPEDLRLAVGHSNIQTTYKFYVMDSREMEDEVFVPDKKKKAS